MGDVRRIGFNLPGAIARKEPLSIHDVAPATCLSIARHLHSLVSLEAFSMVPDGILASCQREFLFRSCSTTFRSIVQLIDS